MKILPKIIYLVLLVFISFSFTQEKRSISLDLKERALPFGLVEYIPESKPTIGLALSGGGVRALSQIGVLKALEENGIHPDIVVGTSMGSVVGGLYAAGFSIDDLDSIAVNTPWGDLLDLAGSKNRRELFIDQKITDDRALFSLRLDGLKLVLPTSFNDGQKLSNYLYMLTNSAPIHPNENFNNLFMRYRAVCTDLETGELVVLNNGPLSLAMRASSSVTFFLEPVNWEGRLLVDGGLLSNIPVDITKKMNADLTIAVNTTSPLHPREKIELPWYIADQVVSIPMKKLNEIQLAHADIIIEPELINKSANDFTNIDSLILLGYKNTLASVQSIKSKTDSLFNKKIGTDEKFLKNLTIHNAKESDLILLKEKYSVMDSVSTTELKKDLFKRYETSKYKNLRIDVTTYPDSTVLSFIYHTNPIVNSVKPIGITQADMNIVKSDLSELVNKYYNSRSIVNAVVKVLKRYRKMGLVQAELKGLDFNERTGMLMLFFDEGVISDIKVEGNFTREDLITREITFKPGEYFTFDKAKESLDNLSSSGFFKDISMHVLEEDNKNIVVISVDEKTSGIMRFGFLLDETYNAQFNVDIRDENIFGSGTEAGLFLYGGVNNGAYIIELKNHRILDTYLTYNISAFYKYSDIGVYEDSPIKSSKTFSRIKTGEYNQTFYGFSLSLGTQVKKFGNLIFTGKYQFDEINNNEGSEVNPYKTKLASLKISTTVDNLDRYPYPQNGLYFAGFYETAQSFLGGTGSYISAGLDLLYYYKIGQLSTIVPRIKAGFGDRTMPLSEQFLLGGMDSFFGMNENEFRGRQIFLSSLTYRFKLPFQIFFDTYIKLRYDLGSTWEEQSQIRFKDLRHGIGGILSFDTPIGPAEFGLGRSFLLVRNIPNNPIKWGDVLFYFSIGYKVNISPASF